MKETIMRCDCCGKRFYEEYWTGGYIDHYENFVRNFVPMIKRGEEEIFHEICYEGNELRDKHDIQCRFKCFKKYCEQNDKLDMLKKVSTLVEKQIKNIQKLDRIHDKIMNMIEGVDDGEKEYIGLNYHKFYSKRLRHPTEEGGDDNA